MFQREFPDVLIAPSLDKTPHSGAFEVIVQPQGVKVWSRLKTGQFPHANQKTYTKMIKDIKKLLVEESKGE